MFVFFLTFITSQVKIEGKIIKEILREESFFDEEAEETMCYLQVMRFYLKMVRTITYNIEYT